MLGASAAFLIARTVGHDAVERLAGPRVARRSATRSRAAASSRSSTPGSRPGVPFTVVNYAAGLTTDPARVFAGATALGAAPRAFAYTALGGSLDDLGSPEAIVALVVLVVMAARRRWCCSDGLDLQQARGPGLPGRQPRGDRRRARPA